MHFVSGFQDLWRADQSLTSEQSASANLIRKYKNILKVIEKASPLLVTIKGNVDSALVAIESAHD